MYLKSVENVITLGKLIGLLFLFCLPLLSILFFENSKNKRNDLARPVMGTIFLVSFDSLNPQYTLAVCRISYNFNLLIMFSYIFNVWPILQLLFMHLLLFLLLFFKWITTWEDQTSTNHENYMFYSASSLFD